jgi:hypothetical protein
MRESLSHKADLSPTGLDDQGLIVGAKEDDFGLFLRWAVGDAGAQGALVVVG